MVCYRPPHPALSRKGERKKTRRSLPSFWRFAQPLILAQSSLLFPDKIKSEFTNRNRIFPHLKRLALKGILITFEGVEGSGKSAQIALLSDRLKRLGLQALTTREPGGTSVGSAIRKIVLDPGTGALNPMTELMLFASARAELVGEVIRPALDNGAVVLCDRFADSTTAYQGYARGMNMKIIERVNRYSSSDIWPDRTIILDLNPAVGLGRTMERMKTEGDSEARFENEGVEFHEKVRDGFLKIAEAEPDRVKVINADDTIDAIHEEVYKAVSDILSPPYRGGD